VGAAELSHLRTQLVDRGGQCRPIEFRFAERDDLPLTRGVEHDLDALYRAILLKANYRVNRSRETCCSAMKCELGPPAQAIRNWRLVRVKDYLH